MVLRFDFDSNLSCGEASAASWNSTAMVTATAMAKAKSEASRENTTSAKKPGGENNENKIKKVKLV